MVTFELDRTAVLTDREKRMIAEAKKLPIVYDDDSPELTDEMERAFIAARRAKPYSGGPLTRKVSSAASEKAKSMGADRNPYCNILQH